MGGLQGCIWMGVLTTTVKNTSCYKMLALEPVEGYYEGSNQPLSALMVGDFLSAEQLLTSHEVLYSIQLVYKVHYPHLHHPQGPVSLEQFVGRRLNWMKVKKNYWCALLKSHCMLICIS
jgi:hypothetical protein